MKVVFYSSNSNYFDGSTFHYYNYPSNTKRLNDFLLSRTDLEVIIITQLPGMFLLDIENNEISEKSDFIKYYIQEPTVDFIKSFNPDLVISASFWVTPFDWLPVADSLIAEQLISLGFKVICNSLETSMICFDKKQTHDFLKNNNFKIAKAVHCHHELFWAERNHKEIKENIYKKTIFEKIKKLKLPLIIKDTTGLSSYGMEVVTTYNQAIGFLNSKKNNSDKLIEEFLDGFQFGTEIHGNKEKGYFIFNPFLFSVNQYGITSPKQSIKLGPVVSSKFKIDELKKELLRLAELMDFNGVVQVDLVFHNDEWFIIEINPRLSGMTQTLLESKNQHLVMALKLPVLSEKELNILKEFDFILHISQVVNDLAKQNRESGYCEIIFKTDLKNTQLNILKEKTPHLIDEGFYRQAVNMIKIIDL